MHYTGPVYRPPFEANSVLLQVTTGCSHNACKFCVMYRDQQFHVSSLQEIDEDLREAAVNQPYADRVFLLGGDAFCLSAKRLLDIAALIHFHLPDVVTITGYAQIQNIIGKTDEELKALTDAGFGMLNIGVESGLDSVLTWMNKGYDVATARKQLARLNKAGLSFSLNIINAAGGPENIYRNAQANAAICNEAQPQLIFVSPLHVDPGSPLEEEVESGGFVECDLGAYIDEEIAFVEGLELRDCVFYGMHISNPVHVEGWLPRDKERVVQELIRGKQRFSPYQLASHPVKGPEGRMYL